MQHVELKISRNDWIYINLLGGIFGLLLGVFLYFIDQKFAYYSIIVFGFFTGVMISFFSAFFITLSNNYILPMVQEKYWYLISFGFSFYSGAFGFLFSYSVFFLLNTKVSTLIEPYSIYLTFIVGFLTFFIGVILHQFIAMKYKNESIRNEILSSKIKALENELNPHFLFNALNSMSELVYIDQKKAEKSILNLSKFLRNAIKTDSLISINNELDMVRTYVEIENIRFEDKIQLHIKKNVAYDIKVPKFSIQLLVENGIKHGYMGQLLDIFITVGNHIEVSNNGKIPQKIKYGTGLSNLNDRLKFFKVGTLESKIDTHVHFYIRIDNENNDS